MGSHQGLWRSLHAIVGPKPESNFNNCCLARTPFPLAVSFPATPQALVAAANDTTPALAVN